MYIKQWDEPKTSRRYFAGVDLGLQHDYSYAPLLTKAEEYVILKASMEHLMQRFKTLYNST
jgi:hypothetical protein